LNSAYYSLYANAHRGRVKKANLQPFPLRIVEEELRPIPSKGWAAMIRKVLEVDPMVCPQCGGTMKVIKMKTYLLWSEEFWKFVKKKNNIAGGGILKNRGFLLVSDGIGRIGGGGLDGLEAHSQ
jgi:hypothetical protein